MKHLFKKDLFANLEVYVFDDETGRHIPAILLGLGGSNDYKRIMEAFSFAAGNKKGYRTVSAKGFFSAVSTLGFERVSLPKEADLSKHL